MDANVIPCVERTSCRLCGKRGLKPVFSLPPTPLANAFEPSPRKDVPVFPLEVMMCNACNHAQLRHVVSAKHMFQNYKYESGTSPVFVDHFARFAADEVARWGVKQGDLVVEIGSNDGTLLDKFQNLGCRVVGVEPAQNLAEKALKRNVQTVTSFFDCSIATNLQEGHGYAKLIVANNVFAHIDVLKDVFRAAQKLLDPRGGVLIFEVQYVGAMLSKGLFDMVYHEHLDYHAIRPLDEFIRNYTGLRVLRVDHVPTHGGSIRVAVGASDLRTAENDKTLTDALDAERTAAVNSPAAWALLQTKVIKARASLKVQLNSIYSEDPDSTLVGFGAPAKATTFMYAMGLKTNDIDYIVDDSTLKQNLYTPGLNVPVRSTEVLLSDHPRYVVVLAWNFAKSIIEKWKPILPQTTFIVPFE